MRSKIEANEYKDYILGFIFYKYPSDKLVRFAKRQDFSETDIRALSGKSFEARNRRRMMQFDEVFADLGIVTPLVSQLSWTHFTILLAVPDSLACLFLAQQAAPSVWGNVNLRDKWSLVESFSPMLVSNKCS
jgi:hypothetical protein